MLDLQREVIARLPKYKDIEIHVSTVTVEGQRFFEVREFIMSLDGYGKGLTLPMSMLPDLKESLHNLEAWER